MKITARTRGDRGKQTRTTVVDGAHGVTFDVTDRGPDLTDVEIDITLTTGGVLHVSTNFVNTVALDHWTIALPTLEVH